MPAEVAVLLESEGPLVLATLGTVYNRRGTLPVLLDALAGQPYRAVLATGSTFRPDDLPTVPANVTVVPWAPFSQLVNRCDVVVHHGGTNTTLLAAREGVPTVVIPLGADQFLNASITAEAGLSRVVPQSDRSASAIGQAVTDVLGDGGCRQRASDTAAEIAAMPAGPPVVQRLVEELVGNGP